MERNLHELFEREARLALKKMSVGDTPADRPA
jgi:hypothetical protein